MTRKPLSVALRGRAGRLWARRPRRRWLVVRYDRWTRAVAPAGRCWTRVGAEERAGRLWFGHIRTCPRTSIDRYRWTVYEEL